MRTNTELQKDVLDELAWEPSVQANDIGVTVHDGVVTLKGRVDTFTQKDRAEAACKRLAGVRAVANDLEVVLAQTATRDDTDIAQAALRALEWNALIPRDTVKVTVRNGWVTLEGTLDWKYQKDTAYQAVATLNGVRGVINSIKLAPHLSAKNIKEKIRAALTRSASLDASHIVVETVGSKVILRGTVRSWAEIADAERAAWAAPGVDAVEVDMEVEAPSLTF